MGEYEDLISQRKSLQDKLRAIELTGEGMENEENIKKYMSWKQNGTNCGRHRIALRQRQRK